MSEHDAKLEEHRKAHNRKLVFASQETERLVVDDMTFWANDSTDGGPRLCCDDCGKGQADCMCTLQWATEDERAARAAEIEAIKEAFAKKAAAEDASPLIQVKLTLPASLATTVAAMAKKNRCAVSSIIERLLKTHSGEQELELETWGKPIMIRTRLSEPLVKRLRLRAGFDKCSLSQLCAGHLARELRAGLSAS